MDMAEALQALHLDDHSIVHDEVGTECMLDLDAIERRSYSPLSIYLQSASSQLCSQKQLICRLEQARTKLTTDGDCGLGDLAGVTQGQSSQCSDPEWMRKRSVCARQPMLGILAETGGSAGKPAAG